MSAVGIDFGNENCYIAVARAGGIETITNDYSQRATPSYVAFGKTCRDLGTSAKNKYITNLSNTVSDFKRLIGKKFKDPVLQHEISYLPYALHELPNGSLGVKVSYLGKDVVFTIHQITAMMFTKLKSIAETALGTKVTDCVVSVPVFFTDAERRAILDVCKIAGLHVLRLINENAAVALTYGFYRQDFSDEKVKKVVFIDVGHSAVQATACEFANRKLKIIANTWDFCLGGRDIDNAMVRHFCQDFQSKYNLNVMTSFRAIIRLVQECEKLKKQLSANPQDLPLNIECFMEDKDVSSHLGREKLDELTSDVLGRIENVFIRLLEESDLRPEDIFAVELVGGTTRIPAIKSLIKNVFRMEPSTTLNLDEAVARGCALQAALLSPALKVKDFSIYEVQPYPIKLSWAFLETERGEIEVFPKNHMIPFSKLYTFNRKEDFVLEAYYCTGDETYPDVLIGSFLIKDVAQGSAGESARIVVKFRLNIHGIFTIRSAVIVEKNFQSTPIDQKIEDILDVEMESLSGSETNLPPIVNEEKKTESGLFFLKKARKVPKEINLNIEPKVPELSESEMKTLEECEQRMILQDQYENDRIDAKNSVEEYIYELRSHIGEDLGKFIEKEELDNFTNRLSNLENWIYEEGENQNREVYVEKLSELKTMASPIRRRKFEHDRRPAMLEEFRKLIKGVQNILTMYLTGSKEYSHVESKDMEMVQRIMDEKNTWFQQHLLVFSQLQPHQDPPISIEQLYNEMQKLKQEIYPLLNPQRSAEQKQYHKSGKH